MLLVDFELLSKAAAGSICGSVGCLESVIGRTENASIVLNRERLLDFVLIQNVDCSVEAGRVVCWKLLL